MAEKSIQELEMQIYELKAKLRELQKAAPRTKVGDYTFETLEGRVSLADLFAGREKLLAIHNMGQGCRYCTLWGDGINPFLPHLESAMSVVMLSKDPPEAQRRFASSRHWRFRTASHGGGAYIAEQTVMAGADNMPGVVLYERDGDQIYRKNSSVFGPGDLYCTVWNLLGLAGLDTADWTPQYGYWTRPTTLDDGGENLLD
jgi:predicted dithiol-disulfide oxidoreductase (DUF899 family)